MLKITGKKEIKRGEGARNFTLFACYWGKLAILTVFADIHRFATFDLCGFPAKRASGPDWARHGPLSRQTSVAAQHGLA